MRRTPIPPGKIGLFMVAAAALPIIAKELKPMANKIASGIIKLGEKLKEATEAQPNVKSSADARTSTAAPKEPTKPKPKAKRTSSSAKTKAAPARKPRLRKS